MNQSKRVELISFSPLVSCNFSNVFVSILHMLGIVQLTALSADTDPASAGECLIRGFSSDLQFGGPL